VNNWFCAQLTEVLELIQLSHIEYEWCFLLINLNYTAGKNQTACLLKVFESHFLKNLMEFNLKTSILNTALMTDLRTVDMLHLMHQCGGHLKKHKSTNDCSVLAFYVF
jgi:hypothetical protein